MLYALKAIIFLLSYLVPCFFQLEDDFSRKFDIPVDALFSRWNEVADRLLITAQNRKRETKIKKFLDETARFLTSIYFVFIKLFAN